MFNHKEEEKRLMTAIAHEQAKGLVQPALLERVLEFIHQADQVNLSLKEYYRPDKTDYTFISLGENCSSAWYLQQVGLKAQSFPFDWIFSSPEIVLDCIDDDFEKFLDKSLIVPDANSKSAGHSYYHSKLFNHRNPLNSDDDYQYYRRCCDRFLELIRSQTNIIYLITLINEPEKRKDWANGFTQNFALPRDQDMSTISQLIGRLRDENSHCRFLVIDHFTNQDGSVTQQELEQGAFVTFRARGQSTGVKYTDAIDDYCSKLILSALI